MKSIVFDDAAREEYHEVVRYYHQIDVRLREDFRQEFRDLMAVVQKNPLLFNLRKHGVRRANLKKFNLYYIAYMLWKGTIVVVAVGHASRRPFYWRRRPKGYRDTHD